jgi:hypothetical protein
LDAEVDINSTWEMISENNKISSKVSPLYYGLNKHKQWFGKGCSKLLDERNKVNCIFNFELIEVKVTMD